MTDSAPARDIVEWPNLRIPMADGCRLAARVWLPADAGSEPVPAILEYLPYRRRDGTARRDERSCPFFAANGYAYVRVDIRGNGDSDGLMHDEYTAEELADGAAVIAWLAEQPWCDGKVGMCGISWGGFNALQVAALRPPALEAIITLCSSDDRYADDIHYKGGCLLTDNLTWSGQMLGYSSRPPDPDTAGEAWQAMWLERLREMPLLAASWLAHQRRDEFWRHGSVCEDYAAIEVPVYAMGGWADAYSNAIPRLLRGLSTPSKALVGPWLHAYPHIAAPQPRFGYLSEALRWWDHWLKGIDSGLMAEPRVLVYLMDGHRPDTDPRYRPGAWLGIEEWPDAHAPRLDLGLGDRLLGDTSDESRALLAAGPVTAGLAGGRFCPGIRLDHEYPADQRADDAFSLTFDTAPLESPLTIVGAATLHLAFRSDRPQAQVALRLGDVHPDGAVTRICLGVMNLSHRNGHDRPEPLPVGEDCEVDIALDDVAYTLPAGHRLRLSLSTAYWPMVWPSPQPVSLTVWTGRSRLSVPVWKGELAAGRDVPPGETWPAQPIAWVRKPSGTRNVTHEASGRVTLETVDDEGAWTVHSSGITLDAVVTERFVVDPSDPRTARQESVWTWRVGRGDWQTHTETRTAMHCDATHYHLEASLEAYHGEELVHRKAWQQSIPRE